MFAWDFGHWTVQQCDLWHGFGGNIQVNFYLWSNQRKVSPGLQEGPGMQVSPTRGWGRALEGSLDTRAPGEPPGAMLVPILPRDACLHLRYLCLHLELICVLSVINLTVSVRAFRELCESFSEALSLTVGMWSPSNLQSAGLKCRWSLNLQLISKVRAVLFLQTFQFI